MLLHGDMGFYRKNTSTNTRMYVKQTEIRQNNHLPSM